MPSLPPSFRTIPPSDSSLLERTFAEHQPSLLRYVTRLLGDHDRARDVVQDTFVKFMAQPPESLNGHAVEWLFAVCRHAAIDVRRREGRLLRLEPEAIDRISSSDPRPGRALEQAETRSNVLALIELLPPNQREVIRLKFQNGFSYQEIARITGLSVGNVGFLLHTAIARLRRDFAARQP